MEKPVIIFGTGAIGRTALEIFKSNGVLVFGFLDEHYSDKVEDIEEIPILGDFTKDVVINEVGKSDLPLSVRRPPTHVGSRLDQLVAELRGKLSQ